jgi:hypothetical protein
MSELEQILPFPAARRDLVPPVTKVRGTWLATSLKGLRAQGLENEYLAKLDPKHAPTIVNAAYKDWIPVDVFVAHYEACDALALPSFKLIALGTEATRLAQGSVVGMVAKLAGGAVASPWPILSQLQRLWDRVFLGGGVSVTKLGPKDARVELAGFPACRYRYCRIGLRGVLTGMTEMFCTKAHVSEIAGWTRDSGGMRIAWV